MSEEIEIGEGGMDMKPHKKWQFWKKGGSKKDKTPPKLGWVMGVLVSECCEKKCTIGCF